MRRGERDDIHSYLRSNVTRELTNNRNTTAWGDWNKAYCISEDLNTLKATQGAGDYTPMVEAAGSGLNTTLAVREIMLLYFGCFSPSPKAFSYSLSRNDQSTRSPYPRNISNAF